MKKYVQCPRCELNYITTPGDKYCKVCMREMKGEGGQDDVEMCSVWLVNPALPGRKVLIKGNHDYWWNSVSKLRRVLPEGMSALQHDALDMGDFVVCGTRGWMFPTGDAPLAPEDERILNRELLRLDMAISAAEKLAQGQKPIVVMLHYPPLLLTVLDTPFTQVLARHRVHTVVYGHLHGAGIRAGFNGEHEGIHYRLTSCDALGFRLTEVPLMTTISNS